MKTTPENYTTRLTEVTKQRDAAWETLAAIKRDIVSDESFGKVVETLFAEPLERAEEEVARLTEERNEWKAKYIQQNKDLGCEMLDPSGTIWEHAAEMQKERAELIRVLTNILRDDAEGHDFKDAAKLLERLKA